MITIHSRCLATIPAARRKGLAHALVRKYCKQFAATEKFDVLAYVCENNVVSLKLFQSVGFKVFNKCALVEVISKSSERKDGWLF